MKTTVRGLVALLVGAALLASCAVPPLELEYRAPELSRQAPEAASGYTEKPG